MNKGRRGVVAFALATAAVGWMTGFPIGFFVLPVSVLLFAASLQMPQGAHKVPR